ncbi:MAG: regulatory protein RecX [Clostridia bacterium]
MTNKGANKIPMDAALDYLTAKTRTVREMELYLDAKQYGEYEVYQAVERLKELNYLNDEKYAEDFIASRLATKPVSRKKLSEQLYMHQLPKDVIEGALASVSDETEEENARRMVSKYWRQFETLPEDERRQRVIKRLVARGYSFDMIRTAAKQVMGVVDASELDVECECTDDD